MAFNNAELVSEWTCKAEVMGKGSIAGVFHAVVRFV